MACYLGETLPSGVVLPDWHIHECFWDSRDGQSPLMQLCRASYLCALAIKAPQINFNSFRIGFNPADTKWGLVDYQVVPLVNPVQDYKNVLDAIHTQIVTTLVGSYVDSSTCKQWHYHPTASVSALVLAYQNKIYSTLPTFTSPAGVRKLFTERMEDWEEIMDAMKEAFEAYKALQIKSDPWTPASVGVTNVSTTQGGGFQNPSLPPLLAANADYGGLVESEININVSPAGSGSGHFGAWAVSWSLQWNEHPYASVDFLYPNQGFYGMGSRGDLFYGIQYYELHGSYPNYTDGDLDYRHIPTTWEGTPEEWFNRERVMGNIGWFQQKRITRRFFPCINSVIPLATNLRNAMNGKVVNWTAKLVDAYSSSSNPPLSSLPHTLSPSSGTFVITSATPYKPPTGVPYSGMTGPFVDITAHLSVEAISASPFVGGHNADGAQWIKDAGRIEITMAPDTFNFCRNACGNYPNAT